MKVRKHIHHTTAKLLFYEKGSKNSLRSSSFSKVNLVLFGLVFAGIGGYLIYQSFAATLPATLYVDQAGLGGVCSDSRALDQVSISTPLCSITRAIALAPDGATVLVRGGTYVNVKAYNILHNDYVTIKPYSSTEAVTLKDNPAGVTSATPQNAAIYTQNATYLRFEGLSIPDDVYINPRSDHIDLINNDLPGGRIHARTVNNLTIIGNKIHDLTSSTSALTMDGSVSGYYSNDPVGNVNITVKDNQFYNVQHDALELFHGGTNVLIENNSFKHIARPAGSTLHTDAVQVAPQNERAHGVTIRNNYFEDVDQGILVKDGLTYKLVIENNVVGLANNWQVMVYDAPGAIIVNNTIDGLLMLRSSTTPSNCAYGTTGCDFAKDPERPTVYRAQNITVANNIISGKFAMDSGLSSISPLSNYSHNLVARFQSAPNPVAAGNIVGAATFIDAANGDYRLAADSLGIDMANVTYAPAVDKEGSTRQGLPDIGALEYTATPFATKKGDLNKDNAIDIYDLSILLSHYDQASSAYDLNNDNEVNILDLSVLLSNYKK